MRALQWGLGFGILGALAFAAMILALATILSAMVQITSEVFGTSAGDLSYWDLVRDTAMGPLTCIVVSGGLAWLLARSPGSTVAPWALGLLSAAVGVVAGYGALHLTVL